MKEYTFEALGFHQYYDLRTAKKKAIESAKEMNEVVYVTMLDRQTFKQHWFTAYPNGNWTVDGKNLSFKN